MEGWHKSCLVRDWWVAGVCCLNWKCPGRGRLFFMSIADEASVALDQLVWPQRDKWPHLQLPLEPRAIWLSPYGFLLPFIFHLPSELWYPVGIVDVIFQIVNTVQCLLLKEIQQITFRFLFLPVHANSPY